jgi:hypothetical protein
MHASLLDGLVAVPAASSRKAAELPPMESREFLQLASRHGARQPRGEEWDGAPAAGEPSKFTQMSLRMVWRAVRGGVESVQYPLPPGTAPPPLGPYPDIRDASQYHGLNARQHQCFARAALALMSDWTAAASRRARARAPLSHLWSSASSGSWTSSAAGGSGRQRARLHHPQPHGLVCWQGARRPRTRVWRLQLPAAHSHIS